MKRWSMKDIKGLGLHIDRSGKAKRVERSKPKPVDTKAIERVLDKLKKNGKV
jgi:hypothetical protein